MTPVTGAAPKPVAKSLGEMTKPEFRDYRRAYNQALGDNLRKTRQKRHLSQRQLGALVGLTQGQLSAIERQLLSASRSLPMARTRADAPPRDTDGPSFT
jgi:DNA-binding XRE family transcriptional regulator